MSTQADEVTRREAVGALVRTERERKGWSVMRAVREAAASPDTKVGRSRWTEIEQAHPPLAGASTLTRVARTLGLDPGALWDAAGYDYKVSLDQEQRLSAARGIGVEIAGDDDADELKQLDADILDELQAIRIEVRRLGDAVEQLVDQSRVPPPPAAPPSRRAARGARQAAPASD